MQTARLLTIALVSTIAVASAAAAQFIVPLEPFRSIELHDGGHVVVRHGQTQRVTILTGNLRSSRVRVASGQRLLIENCNPNCPLNYRLRIEVITPELAAVSVSNGGTVGTVGAFPVQTAIKTVVQQGGTIDVRSMAADAVDASVHQGGRIFTHPRQTLTASVESGGAVVYWGNPRIRQSVRDGGVVERGAPEDADKPLSELGPDLQPVPPVPPVPAIRSHRQ